MTSHLVGVTEIARMLGISRQRVNQLVQSDPTFPAPAAELTGGRIWDRVTIEEWARQREKASPRSPGTTKGRRRNRGS